MPYSIKGKSHKWEENTKVGQEADSKIDRCVQKILADPNFKSKIKGESKKVAAIKVCKSAITTSEEFRTQLS